MQDSRPIVWYITVSNRDAVTARGIAVGDTLKKVMDVYGRPVYGFVNILVCLMAFS